MISTVFLLVTTSEDIHNNCLAINSINYYFPKITAVVKATMFRRQIYEAFLLIIFFVASTYSCVARFCPSLKISGDFCLQGLYFGYNLLFCSLIWPNTQHDLHDSLTAVGRIRIGPLIDADWLINVWLNRSYVGLYTALFIWCIFADLIKHHLLLIIG